MDHQESVCRMPAPVTSGTPEFVDEFAISKMLGVSVQALRNWRIRGGGPPYYKFNPGTRRGLVRYLRSECVDWMATFRRQNSSE
jgi:hypothetical protein